ncbi:MAG: NAD(P)-binding protein [Jiangellales bacterium]
MTTSTTPTTEALVIGGSMAGLVTARVLADHVDHVTVLERRAQPGVGASIAAQGRMLHALLEAGAAGLDRLFPGFRGELRARGAVDGTPKNGRWWNEGYRVTLDSEVTAHAASRGLIETTVRDRVTALANVTTAHGSPVSGLLTANGAVVGVHTPTGDLRADLVVDCSGRSSKAAHWLTDAGLPSPRLEDVGVDVWYSQTVVAHHRDLVPDVEYILTQADPGPDPRTGAAVHIEGQQWIVVLGGYFGDRAPSDPDGFLAYADTLAAPDIATLLRRAGTIGDVITYNFRSSRRWHYETTPPPPGLLPLGDSMCSFNPLYGQGMTVAVLEALALDALLDTHGLGADLPSRAVDAFSTIIDTPWQIAVGADLAYPRTTGTRTPITRMSNAYGTRVLRATTIDPVVGHAMFEVQNLLARPSRLVRPHIVARTLLAQRAWRRNRAAMARATTPAPTRAHT